MKFAIATCSISIVSAVLVAVCHVSSAGDKDMNAPQNAASPPDFEALRTAALSHNADVRVAEAQLERARLQVTKEIMSYYQQWQSASATVTAATAELEQAEQDIKRLKSLSNAVSGTRLLEAERQADVARRQVAAAKQQLNVVKSMLPYIVGASPSTEREDNAKDETSAAEDMPETVEKLLRERLRYLNQVAELQREAYRNGEIGYEAVSSAQRKVLAAKLELAKTVEDRIVIRRTMLDDARALEEIVRKMNQVNEAPLADVLSAKAWTLRVEADLERER